MDLEEISFGKSLSGKISFPIQRSPDGRKSKIDMLNPSHDFPESTTLDRSHKKR